MNSAIDQAVDYALEQMRSGYELLSSTLVRRFGISQWGAEAAIRAADTIRDQFIPPYELTRRPRIVAARTPDARPWGCKR